MHILNLLPFGPLDYMDVDSIQRELHSRVAALKEPDTLIAWEPQPIYTAGRRTQDADIPDRSVPVIRMDRGGSVTYHGPGQLVVYPIVRVRPPKDVVRFVRETELAVGYTLQSHFGLHTSQVEGRSGVWIVQTGRIDRKLCAIGIKFSRETTLHGLALNVTTDLNRFHRVIACGLADADVASLASIGVKNNAGQTPSLHDIADALLPELAHAYQQFLLRPDRATDSLGLWEALHPEQLSTRLTSRNPQASHRAPSPSLHTHDAAQWLARAPLLRERNLADEHTGVPWKPQRL